MVKSYNDSVKRLSREKIKRFIQKNLLPFKKPKNIKVLCFPGAEVEGEEAIEIKEIYDELDIPRQNIVGLEMSHDRAKRLYKANLGIRIEECSDLEYFRLHDECFDIIALDYTGQQNKATVESLAQLIGNNRLSNLSILYTNYSAKRESDAFKRELLLRMASYSPCGKIELELDCDKYLKIHDEELTANSIRYLKMAAEDDIGVSLEHIRDAITYTTRAILQHGRFSLAKYADNPISYVPKIFFKIPRFDDLRTILENSRQESIVNSDIGKITKKAMILSKKIKDDDDWKKYIETPETLGGKYLSTFTNVLSKYIEKRANIRPFQALFLASLIKLRDNKSYGIRDMERYSYVSNKNFLMLMDIYCVSQPWRLYSQIDDIISIDEDHVKYNPLHLSDRKISGIISQMLDQYIIFNDECPLPERKFLGSSWKPDYRAKPKQYEGKKNGLKPINISDADKDIMIDFFEEGFSAKDIHELFDERYTMMQIAGVNAIYTRKNKYADK